MTAFAFAFSDTIGYTVHASGCADLTRRGRGRRFAKYVDDQPEMIEAANPDAAIADMIAGLERSGFEPGNWLPEHFRVMPCACRGA